MKHIGVTAMRMATAALTVAIALSQPVPALASGGRGGFHGGGGFHGVGFHTGAFHGAGFQAGGFGHANFGGDHFGHWRGRGFADWRWDDAWPLVFDDDAFDDGDKLASPSPTPYWYYCQNPAGYYPYVTSCTTSWQTVPAG